MVTFVDDGTPRGVVVNPERMPYGATRSPGNILNVALEAGVDVEHLYGGRCSLLNLSVRVIQGAYLLQCDGGWELDQLEEALDRSHQSRLACLCVLDGSKDIVVEILGDEKDRNRD